MFFIMVSLYRGYKGALTIIQPSRTLRDEGDRAGMSCQSPENLENSEDTLNPKPIKRTGFVTVVPP